MMLPRSHALVAVAGAGKTQKLATTLLLKNDAKKAIGITFTTSAQSELRQRIAQLAGTQPQPRVIGWHAFLLNEIVKPYFPSRFPGKRVSGYFRTEHGADWRRGAAHLHYVTRSGDAYSDRLALLAREVIDASNGSALARLGEVFSLIAIDEFQDLGGNDLEVLDRMMRQHLPLYLVGDPRQATIITSTSDSKNKLFRGPEVIRWLREEETLGNCSIAYATRSHRCHPDILSLADLIHNPELEFPSSASLHKPNANTHKGVWLVDENDRAAYAASIHSDVTFLRYDAKTPYNLGWEILNFKVSKGLTRNHVVVLTNVPIRNLLTKGTEMTTSSACAFYVAVTRARYSVGLVMPSAAKSLARIRASNSRFSDLPLNLWTPPSTSS